MYSFSNFEPVHCSISGSKCCFLTSAQISQEAGKVVWYSHLWRIFQFVVIHTVKGFSGINEAEWMFFWNSLAFSYDPTDVGNLISGSSAFSKSSWYIRKFSLNVLFKPSWRIFEHYLASMWNEHSCSIIWTFFGISFLWDWNENWPFPVLWLLWTTQQTKMLSSFPK